MTLNILIRILLYLAESYRKYFDQNGQNLYGSRKVKMPKLELCVIFTGNKGGKSGIISLSQEYIIFCKVLDEQREKYGMTEQGIKKTIRICKDRNVLKEYLERKETEVVTIMMSLFDYEKIMRNYGKSERHEADRETAERIIKMGKLSLEDVALCVPSIPLDELKEIEADVMQLA